MPEVLRVGDRDIRVEGRLIRFARVDGEKYRFLDDPDRIVDELRAHRARVDLFTFVQKLPQTQPKHSYEFEWDNFAALPITTFENWWTQQIGFKAATKPSRLRSTA